MSEVSMETSVTLRQAFLIMHAFVREHWESVGKPDAIGNLLGSLSLWNTESGGKEPMDAAIFPDWLSSAKKVLAAESTTEGYRDADILFDGKPPNTKVRR